MPECGFAVLDFKTTGLFAEQNDRVVDVAVVHLNSRGELTGSWHSVVNPGRSLGPWRSHDLDAGAVLTAPTFDLIAPRLVELLSGRALVAHNAQFATGFLMSEFARMGYRPRRGMEAICTMQLARDLLPGAGRSLADCCAAFDIDVGDPHSALGQATAAAHLLSAYLLSTPQLDSWADALDRAAGAPWLPLPGVGAPWAPRAVTGVGPGPLPGFLERMSVKLPDYPGPDGHLDYLALLDLCVLNRQLSAGDTAALMQLAASHSIDEKTRGELHTRYCADLAGVAWANGALNAADRAELVLVARMLDVPDEYVTVTPTGRPPNMAAGSVTAQGITLRHGDIVVLTGELARSRIDWNRELDARGFRVASAVTMRTRLLVASDPHAATGKLGKAQDYGIPIVSEFGLRALIGVQ